MIYCKSLSSIFFFVEWLYNSFEMSSSGRGIFADIAVSILWGGTLESNVLD